VPFAFVEMAALRALVFVALMSLASGSRLRKSVKFTQKQLEKAKLQLQQLDTKVYSGIMANAGCATPTKVSLAAKAKVVQQDPDRCGDLCKGKQGCVDVCDEVKTMICDQPMTGVYAISSDNSAAAAAAAAAAATNAVRDAVKDAIADAAASSKQASQEAQDAVKTAVAEASRVAKQSVKEAGELAAKSAAESAAKEAAMSAHAIASTAAAAATAAARMAGSAAAPAAGAAPAPGGPAPAPAGF